MSNITAEVDQKVTIKTKQGEEFNGLIEASNELGVVLKPKGSSRSVLIETKDIASVETQAQAEKKLRSRSLPQVNDGKHRAHLLDRHGYKLAEINAMTEAEAAAFHTGLDHSELGHFHREETAIEAELNEAEGNED